MWLTYDSDSIGEFTVESKICHACKVIEDDETKPPPGSKRFLTHDMFNPNRVPSKRGRRQRGKPTSN